MDKFFIIIIIFVYGFVRFRACVLMRFRVLEERRSSWSMTFRALGSMEFRILGLVRFRVLEAPLDGGFKK